MAVQTPSTNRANRKSATPRKDTANARKLNAGIDPERRHALIAEAAYLRAERRGFQPGREEEDWLAAEAEVDTALALGADRVVQ